MRACVALVAALVVLAAPACAANEVALAGPGSETTVVQPCGIWNAFHAGPGRSLVSTSSVDTAVSFATDWASWQASGGGVVEICASAIAAEGRSVVALLGDPDAPALTLAASGSDWTVCPAGVFPANESQPLAPSAITTSIRLTLHAFASGRGRLAAETQSNGGPWESRPDLTLSDLGWSLPLQNPAFWDTATAGLTGDGATLTELRLRIFRSPTLFLLR